MNSLIELLIFGALYFFAFHYTIKDANISNDDYCIKIYDLGVKTRCPYFIAHQYSSIIKTYQR